MNLFRYETHLHTKEASACALATAVEHVRNYKALGYAGIIVTDHFFNGNSSVPTNLPWQQRVDLLCKGYENAKEEGDRIGLSVFFGWEANYKSTEFLIYGLDKEWLKSHQEIMNWTIEEQYRNIHAAGGFIVHAHPFRLYAYHQEARLYPDSIDAVEAINACNLKAEYNDKAIAYAKRYNLPVTAGTDAHGSENNHIGVAFGYKLTNIKDYISSIKSGGYELLN
jgi:hypothetical protein